MRTASLLRRGARTALLGAACVVAACSDSDRNTADSSADTRRMRDEIATLALDVAKATAFFPDEYNAVRESWEHAGDSFDKLSEAYTQYQNFHHKVNSAAWISNFGGDGFEEAAQVVVNPEGGYIIAGDTTSFGAGQRDMFVVDVDASGNERQRIVHGGAENDSALAIAPVDAGVVVAGRTSSFEDWTGDAYIVRMDADGQAAWEQHFGATGTDSIECVIPRANGFLAIGNTYEGGGGRKIFVATISTSGELSNKSSVPSDQDAWVNAGVVLDDGRIALAGGRGTVNAAEVLFLLLVLNPDATVALEKTYDLAGAATTGLTGVAAAPDGEFYLVGQTMASLDASEDIVIMRVGPDGETRWNETLHADDEDYSAGVVEANDGAAVFAGSTRTFGAGGSDILLVKYSPEGKEVWARTLGSEQDESAHAIAATPDGGFLVAGERGTFIEGIQDLYAVKTNSEGFSWMGHLFGSTDLVEAHDHDESETDAAPMDMPEESLEVGQEAPAIRASAWFGVPEDFAARFTTDEDLYAETIGAPLTVVEFWATWCGPCKITIPHLNELKKKYVDKGVIFVSLTDEDAAQVPVENFVRENNMQTIVGSGSPSGAAFGAWVIPHAYLIDRHGKIVWIGHPMDGLDEAIEAALGSAAE